MRDVRRRDSKDQTNSAWTFYGFKHNIATDRHAEINMDQRPERERVSFKLNMQHLSAQSVANNQLLLLLLPLVVKK